MHRKPIDKRALESAAVSIADTLKSVGITSSQLPETLARLTLSVIGTMIEGGSPPMKVDAGRVALRLVIELNDLIANVAKEKDLLRGVDRHKLMEIDKRYFKEDGNLDAVKVAEDGNLQIQEGYGKSEGIMIGADASPLLIPSRIYRHGDAIKDVVMAKLFEISKEEPNRMVICNAVPFGMMLCIEIMQGVGRDDDEERNTVADGLIAYAEKFRTRTLMVVPD